MDREEITAIIEQLNADSVMDLTLDAVVEQAVRNVPRCTSCSVFIRKGSDGVYDHDVAYTHPTAGHLDERQLTLGEGPCLDLTQYTELVSSADLRLEDRWPRWTAEAREADIRSVLAVRLPVEGRLHACLNMYAADPNVFDDEATDLALIYARLAVVAVQNAWESAGLRSALSSRLAIGVAQGILMQQYGISLNQAFEVLRRRSTETNTKLRVLAIEVVRLNDPTAFGPGEDAAPSSSA